MKNIKALLVIICFMVSVQGFSWGSIGHRIVGQIASSHINKKTQKAIKEILGDETLAIASTWADEFGRSDSAYKHTASWHYINMKDGLSYAEFSKLVEQDTSVNAYTRVNFLISELKKNEVSLDLKKFYLRMLVHLIGDLHQPMHVSRKEDYGGNMIKVLWMNDPTNIHSVWDSELIENQKLSYTEYATSLNYGTKEQIKKWQQQPMNEWFFESYEISAKIYKSITQKDQKLSFSYNFENIEIMNQRLLVAGVRLAEVLNQIYS